MSETTEIIDSEPVVEAFGRPAAVRIMVILTDGMGAAMPAADIAEQANVTQKSVYNNIGMLAEYGLVEQADEWLDGGTKTAWKAPMDAEPVQGFIHLRDAVLDHVAVN